MENGESGSSLVKVSGYVLEGYRDCAYAPLRISGLQDESQALLWIQHAQHTARNLLKGQLPKQAVEASFLLSGLRPGEYEVEWWDCWKGEVISQERVISQEQRLRLNPPPILRDIACKIRQVSVLRRKS